MGLVVIATNFSGQTEYMVDGQNALLAKVTLQDRGDGHRWAIVDEEHLANLLKSVCDSANRERMRGIGLKARSDMLEKYSISVLATTIHERLKTIVSNREERNKDEL